MLCTAPVQGVSLWSLSLSLVVLPCSLKSLGKSNNGFHLVIADECLALQNTESLQSAAAWRLVTRSLYGGHFISGTMFRRHYRDLLEMLKMLGSSLPLRSDYVQSYFRVYLITYMRPTRPWETRLESMSIPEAVRQHYLEVLDECRGKDAQNYTQVLSRMRRVLNDALRGGRPLAEQVWRTAMMLRGEGYRPIVFSNTEREAEAMVRHIGCARRYRHGRHPAHCPGCDVCRGFNKFATGVAENQPISGSDSPDTLWIFNVGLDAQGLNLQSYGDALIVRPTQMDLLVQMMGRLDRPGQIATKLCRAIVYIRRTHEEAEVAHLEKHAAFWSLHIKPMAKAIVTATVEADVCGVAVDKRYHQIAEAASSSSASLSGENDGGAAGNAIRTGKDGESLWGCSTDHSLLSIPPLMPRQFLMSLDVGLNVDAGKKAEAQPESSTAGRFKRLRRQPSGHSFAIDLSSPPCVPLDLTLPDPGKPTEWPSIPTRMTRDSICEGLSFLIRHDPRFKHMIRLLGPPTSILNLLEGEVPDPFTTIAQTICHQQLSMTICKQMFDRLLGLCGDRDLKVLVPARVVATPAETIREVAQLSFRKIEYIKHAAQRFQTGDLNTQMFEEATDEQLRRQMSELPGIGEWTTEMFLIFQSRRHGGIPYGDVALQSAMKMVYDLRPPVHLVARNEVNWSPTRRQMEERAERWGPYGSIATLYLLRIADNEGSAVFLPD